MRTFDLKGFQQRVSEEADSIVTEIFEDLSVTMLLFRKVLHLEEVVPSTEGYSI